MQQHNQWNRRASDTTNIAKRRRHSQFVARLSLPIKLETLPKPSNDIWTGPEELIEGRFIAKKAGFLPTKDSLQLTTQAAQSKTRSRDNSKLNVIDTASGKPFAGGARIKVHSDGFDLLDKSSRVVVKCLEEVDTKLHQRSVVICSTESLTESDEPVSRKPIFYRWFKASLDSESREFSLDLWSGSQYYPLWYSDKIRKGEDVSLKTISEDDQVAKLCSDGVMSCSGMDPALMICLSVAVQRLTIATTDCPTESR